MTRQQRWSSGAYARVVAQHSEDRNNIEATKQEAKYRSYCLKAPVLIKQSGLVQALAFLRSRDEAGQMFCDHLAQVYGVRPNEELLGVSGTDLLIRAHDAGELSLYLAMTRDLIAVSVWFRRFAQSELEGNDD